MTEIDLVAALRPVAEAFDALGVRYFLAGSVASSAHGVACSGWVPAPIARTCAAGRKHSGSATCLTGLGAKPVIRFSHAEDQRPGAMGVHTSAVTMTIRAPTNTRLC